MRIVFIIDSLGSGGAQRMVSNLIKGLIKKYKIKVLLYKNNNVFYKDPEFEKIDIDYICTKKKGFNFQTIGFIRRNIKSSDLLISFMPTANIYTTLAKLFKRKIKHISCEVSIKNNAESKFKRITTNLCYFLSNHVICNNFTQANYLKSLPFLSKKVSTIWNGCKEFNYVKKESDVSSEQFLLIVGRVAYPKNGLRVLQALNLFNMKYGYVPKIVWAGRRDLSDNFNIKSNKEIDNYLKSNKKLSTKFSFVGEVKKIEELYKRANGLICVSTFEGVPFVICESMFIGCPVLASDISDNGKILGRNNERGILCNPYNIEDICDSINFLINMPQYRKDEMTKAARNFALSNFTENLMVEKYKNIIKKLIEI